MSDEFETQEVTLEEALQMQIYTNQALIDIMVDKGLVTYEEIITRVEELKVEHGFEVSGLPEQ